MRKLLKCDGALYLVLQNYSCTLPGGEVVTGDIRLNPETRTLTLPDNTIWREQECNMRPAQWTAILKGGHQ